MLVISRRVDERIQIGDIVVTVVRIQGAAVRLGIEAPDGTVVMREELLPPGALDPPPHETLP